MLTVVMAGVPGLALGISRGRNRPRGRCSADSPLHSSISFLLFSAPPPAHLFCPGHSLLVDSSSCLILGFWKWEGGLACGCVLLAVGSARRAGGCEMGAESESPPARGGGSVRASLSRVCHPGNQDVGDCGSPPGTPAHPAGVRAQQSSWRQWWLGSHSSGVGVEAGWLAIAFRLSLLLLFFFTLNNFFNFLFYVGVLRLTALCLSPVHGKVTQPYISTCLCCLKPACPALRRGSWSLVGEGDCGEEALGGG